MIQERSQLNCDIPWHIPGLLAILESDLDGILAEQISAISHKIRPVPGNRIVAYCLRSALVAATRNHEVPRSDRASSDPNITVELNFGIPLSSLPAGGLRFQ